MRGQQTENPSTRHRQSVPTKKKERGELEEKKIDATSMGKTKNLKEEWNWRTSMQHQMNGSTAPVAASPWRGSSYLLGPVARRRPGPSRSRGLEANAGNTVPIRRGFSCRVV